jgi:hypothetical protein
MIRTYRELRRLLTIEERYRYLALHGQPGDETFGFDRYINQMFYKSREWQQLRNEIIVRDEGCDLGVPGFEIHGRIAIHHMNPMRPKDDFDVHLDQEFLITTSHRTHNAIHYGDESQLPRPPLERRRGDTKLW